MPNDEPSGESGTEGVSDLKVAHAVYGLQAASFVLGFTSIVGVTLDYARRDRVRGTWLESHFT